MDKKSLKKLSKNQLMKCMLKKMNSHEVLKMHSSYNTEAREGFKVPSSQAKPKNIEIISDDSVSFR